MTSEMFAWAYVSAKSNVNIFDDFLHPCYLSVEELGVCD